MSKNSIGFALLGLILGFNLKAQTASTHNLPQGISKAQLYFAEWQARKSNASCDILVEGDSITILQNEETNLTGGKVIHKGILLRHKSGIWIIGDALEDVNADEVGGCSDGPIPIDIETRVIEWC